MIVEILSTGDELRTGSVVDTNASYISSVFEESGIEISRHSCVGDEMKTLVDVLLEIGNRADIAIVTGGLGPTTDDITIEASAVAGKKKLVINETALKEIDNYFNKINKKRNESDLKQALIPEGSIIIPNNHGTAPGVELKINKCRFFFLPGVPYEMKFMLNDFVLPAIQKNTDLKSKYNIIKNISLFGLGEAEVNTRLSGIDKHFSHVRIGYRAIFPEIQVKLYGSCDDLNLLNSEIEKASELIIEKVGEWIFSKKGLSMEAEVGSLLLENNSTIALAESCTGGLISSMLTDVPGSSDYFIFSGVTYSNDAKIKVLNVPVETIEKHGAVHEETAKLMAENVRKITGATWGLSTSGIAGPRGGTDEKPVGTVCIGVASQNDSKSFRFNFHYGDRAKNKKIFAIAALNLLRKEILKKKISG